MLLREMDGYRIGLLLLVEAAQKAAQPDTEVRTGGYKADHRFSAHTATTMFTELRGVRFLSLRRQGD